MRELENKGIARKVSYEERQKKLGLSNRLCGVETPEEEMAERQDIIGKSNYSIPADSYRGYY